MTKEGRIIAATSLRQVWPGATSQSAQVALDRIERDAAAIRSRQHAQGVKREHALRDRNRFLARQGFATAACPAQAEEIARLDAIIVNAAAELDELGARLTGLLIRKVQLEASAMAKAPRDAAEDAAAP